MSATNSLSGYSFSGHFCIKWSLLPAFLMVLALFFGFESAHAQSPLANRVTITGVVRDASTGQTLSGAHLQFESVRETGNEDANRGVVTDHEGRFMVYLETIPYTVTVSFIGFTTWTQFRVDPAEIAKKEWEIALEPSEFEINPITVSASRRPERMLDAPAAVTILEPKELQSRTALTAASHLAGVPGVDLVNTGLVSSRIVIRGFNDNLATSLLTLVDHRISAAPSSRLTALQLIPMSNGDLDQIEVVSGPASALYGPNAANGVVHMVTKSPFDSKGTTVSLAGGQQDVLLGSFRHAGVWKNKLGYKVSAQYYTGTDFEYMDPEEIAARQEALVLGAQPDTLRIGQRSFDVRNIALNTRLDYRLRPGSTLIFNAGTTRGNNIEITPTGAAQVENARISYAQIRLNTPNMFVQAYANLMNSGSSYFLRTGQVFKDVSKMVVAQIQRISEPSTRQRFTYGIDAFYTIPEGEGTVNGRNENDDNVQEYGAYVQSETRLGSKFNVVGAARVDYHAALEKTIFSPRAAIVFKPQPSHTFRLTFNQAFRTPLPNDIYSDVLGLGDVFTLGRMESLLGFRPTTDLRVQGMQDGFHFATGNSGLPQFRSPFAPLDPRGRSTSDYIEQGDPVFTNVMWSVARQATVAGLSENLIAQNVLQSGQANALSEALEAILPQQVSGVGNAMQRLDLGTQSFLPIAQVSDFPTLDVVRTRTIELGYKGLIAPGIIASIDVYRSDVSNFIGPFAVGTPNIFLDSPTLNNYLVSSIRTALQDPANAAYKDVLLALDRAPQVLGNSDGDPSSELAFIIAAGVAGAIPFGTVSPTEAFDPTAVLLMRRNFGDVSVNGVDLNIMAFLSRQLRIGLMYSWLSDNYFKNVANVDDISLNAPRSKVGAQIGYEFPDDQFGFTLRGRYVQGFDVRSDVYIGSVDTFVVFDGSLEYEIPFSRSTRVNLTIQNLTNNRHREFVFVPEIGRLALLRLTHQF